MWQIVWRILHPIIDFLGMLSFLVIVGVVIIAVSFYLIKKFWRLFLAVVIFYISIILIVFFVEIGAL